MTANATAPAKPTHAELKQRAKELGIPGRTQMRRAELEQAIAAALAGEPVPTPARKTKRPETQSDLYAALSESAKDLVDDLDRVWKATPYLLAGMRDAKAHEWRWLFDPREKGRFGRISQNTKDTPLEYPIPERGPELSIARVLLVDGAAAFELHDGSTVRLPTPELCDKIDAERSALGLTLLTYVSSHLSKSELAPEEIAALELFGVRQEIASRGIEAALRELRKLGFIDEPRHKRVAKRTVARALYSEEVRGPSAALANRTLRKTNGEAVGEGGTTIRTVNLSKQAVALARLRADDPVRKRSYENYAIQNTRIDHHLPIVVLYVKLLALQACGLGDLIEFEPEWEWDATGKAVRTDLMLRLARPEAFGDPDAAVSIAVETDMGSATARDPRPGDKASHLLWSKFDNYQELGRALKRPAGRELRLAFLTPPFAELFEGTAPAARGSAQQAVYERWKERLDRQREREAFVFIALGEPTEANLATALEKVCAKAYQDYVKSTSAKSG